MADYVEETRKSPADTPVDVVVAGGGIAGISAALAAARCKAKVLLIEKQCILGGLATAGLVAIYLPLCDGSGNQMSYGIAEELFRLSIRYGAAGRYPGAWLSGGTKEERAAQRYEVQFNPQMLALLAEELLLAEGVELLLDTKICGVKQQGNRLGAVFVENKSGRRTVRAKTFVDATGDADLCWYAGMRTVEFAKKNTLAGWYYEQCDAGVRLNMLGFADAPEGSERDAGEPLDPRRYSGLDGRENTEYLCASHRATLADIRRKKEAGSICEPVAISTMPQFRMTRRIAGAYTLREAQCGQTFADSIGMAGDWRKRGMRYEIPYGVLYSDDRKNLICAGRCVSADDGMWDILRAIPCCAVTGQAAGIAAAMTDDVTNPDIRALQEELGRQGQRYHFGQIGL